MDESHPLYERAKEFKSYFMHKEFKDDSNKETKFEKGFRRLFLTHQRLANDPDDCYVLDNPQVKWYGEVCNEIFSSETRNAVEDEFKSQFEKIAFLCNCMEWAYFASNISSEIQIVRRGYGYPNAAVRVMIGILISCKWYDTTCSFIFDNDSFVSELCENFPKFIRDYTSNKSIDLFTPASTFRVIEIKNDEDIDELTNSTSSAELRKSFTSNRRTRHKSTNSEFKLMDYLSSIGYPDPYYLKFKTKEILEYLIGPCLVSQLAELFQKQSHMLDELNYFELIPTLLKIETSGHSSFSMNNTETAAVSASLHILVSSKSQLMVRGKKVTKACFEITNAKTFELQIKLNIFVSRQDKEPEISLNLTEYLNLEGSTGTTLAEHLYKFAGSNIFNKKKQQLTLGEYLRIVLGHHEHAYSISSDFPMFLSFLLFQCKIKDYLSYIKLRDNGTLEQAHIYLEPPDFEIELADGVKLSRLQSLGLHLFCYVKFENIAQLEGIGSINGHSVKFKSSIRPKGLEITFIDEYIPNQIFSLLNHTSDSSDLINHSLKITLEKQKKYEVKWFFLQPIPYNLALKFAHTAFKLAIEDLKPLLPPQLTGFEGQSTFALVSSSPELFAIEANFTINISVAGASIDLKCSCNFVQKSSCTVMLVPLFKPFKYQDCLTKLTILPVVDAVLGQDLIFKLQMFPVTKQVLQISILKKLQLFVLEKCINKIELFAFISKFSLLSEPCHLTFHSASLELVYSNDGVLQLDCKGKLDLQWPLQEGTKPFRSSFNGQFIFPQNDNRGIVCFDNYDTNVTLSVFIRAFGWSKNMFCFPSAHSEMIKKVCIEFSSPTCIHMTKFSLSLKELVIRVLKFSFVELAFSVIQERKVFFDMSGLIGDDLFAQLSYSFDSCLLNGTVTVCDFCAVNAPDAVKIINLSSPFQSFINMKMVLEDCFMDIFKSAANDEDFGLLDFINISIYVTLHESKNKDYILKHFQLQVKDCVEIKNFIFDTIYFEFLNQFEGPNDNSTARVAGTLRNIARTQNMFIAFDVTTHSEKPVTLSAKIIPEKEGAFSLTSLFELAGCVEPVIPKIGFPSFFERLIVRGSIDFTLDPFVVCKFDVTVVLPEWIVFSDPYLYVEDLHINCVWEIDWKEPQLNFNNCTAIFQDEKLNVSGRLTPVELLINFKNSLSPTKVMYFESLLRDYTPSGISCPDIPNDILLPPLQICSIELDVKRTEHINTLSLKGVLPTSSVWHFMLGELEVKVDEISGVLEWRKENGTIYYNKAMLHGFLHLGTINVAMHMLLGNDIDSILLADLNIVHYGQIADSLTSQPQLLPNEETTFDVLVPQNLKGTTSLTAKLAFNVTKKQVFLSGSNEKWGHCTLLVGYLSNQNDIDYAVTVNVCDTFKFSRLSQSLAFVDDYVAVQCASLSLVSSVDINPLSNIINSFEATYHQEKTYLQNPFAVIPSIATNKLAETDIKQGTSIYTTLDVAKCKESNGTIGKLFQLGDPTLEESDIIVKVSWDRCNPNDIEVCAFISQIKLLDIFTFLNIELLYKVSETTETSLELGGELNFSLDMYTSQVHPVTFLGQLSVNSSFIDFQTIRKLNSNIDKPAGLQLTLRELELVLHCELCENQTAVPDVIVYGLVSIGNFDMKGKILLKGLTFKVFEISLVKEVHLKDLFACSYIEWAFSFLQITINKGKFYYSEEEVSFFEEGSIICYKKGFNLNLEIHLFYLDFKISAQYTPGSEFSFRGRSINKINLGLAKLTGKDDPSKGPEIVYENKTITLIFGVELFFWKPGEPLFIGETTFDSQDYSFTGSITYKGKILWIENPEFSVKYSLENKNFEIVDCLIDNVPFNLMKAIKKVTKVIARVSLAVYITWDFKLSMKTGVNPDPSKYLCQLVLSGNLAVNVVGVLDDIPVIPLPELQTNILKTSNFSLSQLPKYILICLWNNAGDIVKSLLSSCKFIKKIGENVFETIESAIGQVKEVINFVKGTDEEADKIWNYFFGHSAFIVDSKNDIILGYIFAGKDKKPLYNLDYIVNNFGDWVTAHMIKETADNVYISAKTCLQMQSLQQEIDFEHKSKIKELKDQTQNLLSALELEASCILTINYVAAKFFNDKLCIEWTVGDKSGNLYNEDRGDIMYHVKVVATLRPRSGHTVETKQIFNGNIEVAEYREIVEKAEICDDHILHEHKEIEQNVKTILSAYIPIDDNILSETLYFIISIQPSVTLAIRTLPKQKPIDFNEELNDVKDEQWIKETKAKIDEIGKDKEYTLIGKRKTTIKKLLNFTKAVESKIVKSYSFEYSSDEQQYIASGEILTTPEIDFYLIQIFDTTDETIIIGSEHISTSYNESITKFSIAFVAADIPKNSQGPYSVFVLPFTSTFECLNLVTLSEATINRCGQPCNTSILLKSSEEKNYNDTVHTVTITWNSPPLVLEDNDYYEFFIEIFFKNLDEFKNIKDLKENFSPVTDKDFYKKLSSFTTKEENYSFNLKTLLLENNISLHAGGVMKCEIFTCTASNKKLPSLPSSQKIILLSSPSNISTKAVMPGLSISWTYGMHALDHQIDFIDKAKGTVKHSKHHKFDISKSARSRAELQVDIHDLKCLLTDEQNLYNFQIISLGFADTLFRCLAPTMSAVDLNVFSVALQYNMENDVVILEFTPLSSVSSYEISLYSKDAEDSAYKFLSEQSVHTMASLEHKITFEFFPHQWRHFLSTESCITAYVCAKDKDVFNFGVTSNDLMCISSLENEVITTQYYCDWTVSNIELCWDATNAMNYQYGFATNEGSVIWKNYTSNNKAIISYSELSANFIDRFHCFVKSIGNSCLVSSNMTLFNTTLFQCVFLDQQKVIFTNVSLLQIQKCNIKIRRSCLVPTFHKKHVFPSGSPFPSQLVPKRIFQKFWSNHYQSI